MAKKNQDRSKESHTKCYVERKKQRPKRDY